MPITKIDLPTASTPSFTPGIVDDYNAQNDHIQYRILNVTPQIPIINVADVLSIPVGSQFNIGGALYVADEDVLILGAVGNYIKMVLSGSDAIPTFTESAGTWDGATQGFYESGELIVTYRRQYDVDIQTVDDSLAVVNGVIGIAFDGSGNLLTLDSSKDLRIHSGFTSTVSSTVNLSVVTGSPRGIAFHDGNLYVGDANSEVWKLDGLTNSVLSSITLPTIPNDLDFMGGDLIYCASSDDLMRRMDGFTNTTNDSFSTQVVANDTPQGVATDQEDLIYTILDGIASPTISRMRHSLGFSNTAQDTKQVQNNNIVWGPCCFDGQNFYYIDNDVADTVYKLETAYSVIHTNSLGLETTVTP